MLTIQREFAERLAASPRTKDYGALTLLIGKALAREILAHAPGSVFLPKPKVDSAMIALTPRPSGEVPDCDGRAFTTLVKQGFSQRRKQLRENAGRFRFKLAGVGREDWRIPDGARGGTWLGRMDRAHEFVMPCATMESGAQDVHRRNFDVVDENDRVVSHASRHEVHRAKLRHRAVHVFVFNGAGELFLQKRSRWKDTHPGKWDSSAAGHVNSGDNYAATAPREMAEELGVTARAEFAAENFGQRNDWA